MCLWDNKAGRKKETVGRAAATVNAATSVNLFAADPNRTAVLVSVVASDAALSAQTVLIRSGSATGPVLAALSAYSPSVMLRVEDCGDGVFGPIWATCGDAVGYSVNSSVVRLNEQLERVA